MTTAALAPVPRALEALRRIIEERPRAVAVSLFVIACAARLALVLTSRFTEDEVTHWEVARHLASGREYPLLGPIVSAGDARVPGPLFYYVMAIPAFFSSAPEAANVFVAVCGAFAVLVFWSALGETFGAFGAAVAGLLMACMPWSTLYADRIWNCNAPLGLVVALAFWAACRLRTEVTRGRVVTLLVAMAAMPQFHLSTPMVWVALAPLFLPTVRRWRWHWVLLGVLGGALLYVPTLMHELRSHWSNLTTLLHEGAKNRSTDFARVPAWAFRLMTLDISYHQLHSYWDPRSEREMVAFIFEGNVDFQYDVLRWFFLGLSVVLAAVALVALAYRAWSKDGRRTTNAFFWALVLGVLANTALLGVTQKDLFGHYVQPLIPFYFVAFAALAQWSETRSWRITGAVALATLLVSIGGIDAATWVSQRMDSRTGLYTIRKVIAAIEKDQPKAMRVGLDISYPGDARGSADDFNAVGSIDTVPHVGLFEAEGPYLLRLSDQPKPKKAVFVMQTGPVTLYRVVK